MAKGSGKKPKVKNGYIEELDLQAEIKSLARLLKKSISGSSELEKVIAAHSIFEHIAQYRAFAKERKFHTHYNHNLGYITNTEKFRNPKHFNVREQSFIYSFRDYRNTLGHAENDASPENTSYIPLAEIHEYVYEHLKEFLQTELNTMLPSDLFIYEFGKLEKLANLLQGLRIEELPANIQAETKQNNPLPVKIERPRKHEHHTELKELKIYGKVDIGKFFDADDDVKKRLPENIEAKYETDFETKILVYTQLIKEDWGISDSYYHFRGRAKYYLKDYQGAYEDFSKTTSETVFHVSDLFIWRGCALRMLKDSKNALKDFSLALVKSDSSYEEGNAYFHRGALKYDLGRYEEALEDLDRSIGLCFIEEAYYFRGKTLLKLKRDIEALGDFMISNGINPGRADVYRILKDKEIPTEKIIDMMFGGKKNLNEFEKALRHFCKEEYEEAIECIMDCTHTSPDDYIFSGAAYERAILPELAETDLNEALKMGSTLAYLWKARLKYNTGDLKGAVKDATNGLKFHSSNFNLYDVRCLAKLLLDDPTHDDDLRKAEELKKSVLE